MLKNLEDIVFDKEIKAGAARRSSLIAVPVPDAIYLVLKWLETSDNSSRNYNAEAVVPNFNSEPARCCSVVIKSPKPTSTQPRPTPNPPPSPLPKPLPTPFSPPLP